MLLSFIVLALQSLALVRLLNICMHVPLLMGQQGSEAPEVTVKHSLLEATHAIAFFVWDSCGVSQDDNIRQVLCPSTLILNSKWASGLPY